MNCQSRARKLDRNVNDRKQVFNAKNVWICLLCVGLSFTVVGCTQPNELNKPEETVSALSPVENEVSEIQEEGMMLSEEETYDYEIQELCTERDTGFMELFIFQRAHREKCRQSFFLTGMAVPIKGQKDMHRHWLRKAMSVIVLISAAAALTVTVMALPLKLFTEQALEVYPSAELKVMSDAGHGFHGEDVQQAIDWILEYLQNHQD